MTYFQFISQGAMPYIYVMVFLISVSANILSEKVFRKVFLHRRGVKDLTQVQAMHSSPTPRAGGMGLVLAACICLPFASVAELSVGNLITYMACLIPLFAAGFSEDIGYSVRPIIRFTAATVSGILVIYVSGLTLDNIRIPILDAFLSFTPVAVAFTLIAVTGVTNAFNFIDGLNGLAACTAGSIVLCLSIAFYTLGDPQMANTVIILMPLLLGFLTLNYPFGKIFLGDTGAYLLGFILAWLSIYICKNNLTVSPFALLMIFFWPVADTLLAIWRRFQLGNRPSRPDRLHYHQLVIRWLNLSTEVPNKYSNPIATAIILPMVIVAQIIGLIFLEHLWWSLFALIGYSLFFFISYVVGIWYASRRKYFWASKDI
ncbi:undecaprenyl/decaprenyl-phosphate alpha-N-acetylglucosaminyl 1-phosphate transferase [Planktomarina temperata]|nr:undecaprenyl/decaprenyl-phosphate alpha-N-acetylglucosaminyl 1-phosphate transferase [Planktomarina temperata]